MQPVRKARYLSTVGHCPHQLTSVPPGRVVRFPTDKVSSAVVWDLEALVPVGLVVAHGVH